MRTAFHWLGWAALLAPFVWGQLGFDFTDYLASLDAELEGELAALVEAIVFVFDTLVAFAEAVVPAINFTYLGAFGMFQSIQQFFHSVWCDYILVWLAWITKHLKDLDDWLGKKLAPLVDFLKRLVAMQNAFYNQFLKPLLNMIIALRRFVTVLHLFHLHFLDKLDNYLAGLESKILGNFFKTRAWLNQLLTWIEIFLNPFGYINRALFMASLGNAIDDVCKLFTTQGVSYFSATGTTPAPAVQPPWSVTDIVAEVQANQASGQGFYIDIAQQGANGLSG